jgi:hypothetical protein
MQSSTLGIVETMQPAGKPSQHVFSSKSRGNVTTLLPALPRNATTCIAKRSRRFAMISKWAVRGYHDG